MAQCSKKKRQEKEVPAILCPREHSSCNIPCGETSKVKCSEAPQSFQKSVLKS